MCCAIAAMAGCDQSSPTPIAFSPPKRPQQIDPPVEQAASGHPNLVLISIDTLRADRLSAYGHDRPTSPHIDRLAADAALFENAFSHSPKTAASHMSLMTGLYPESHRVKNRLNGAEGWSGSLSADIPTLAEFLSAAGYRAHAHTSGGNMEGDIGFARGFATYSSPVGGEGAAVFRPAMQRLNQLAQADQPFFLFVHTYRTHSPYLAAKHYQDLFVDREYQGTISSDLQELVGTDSNGYDNIYREFWSRVDRESEADRRHLLNLYDACIRNVDDQVGGLLDRIDALGLRESTLVVLVSDHGEEFGEHEGFEHNALWRELLHVPLIIRVPAGVRSGWQAKRIEAAVGLVDVLPTLLDLMRIPIPRHFQGRSLSPIIESGAAGRPYLFAQYRLWNQSSLSAANWKLLQRGPYQQVFDLASDPAEFHDVTSTHPEILTEGVEQMEQILEASRAYWPLARDGQVSELDSEQRRRLEALGYGEEG
jgi:arylsulfatase